MTTSAHTALGPIALKISDPLQAAKAVRERHQYWCDRVRTWLIAQGSTPVGSPACKFSWMGRRKCGCYWSRSHTCGYFLPYVMMLGIEEYDETIAHEVVHAFQRCWLPKCKSHGEAFYLMMRLACGFAIKDHFHQYSSRSARRVEKLLTPVKKLFDAAGVKV